MTPVNGFIGSPKTLHPSSLSRPSPTWRQENLPPALSSSSQLSIYQTPTSCKVPFEVFSRLRTPFHSLSSQTSPEIKHFLPAERCSSFVFQVCFMASPFTRSLGVVSSSALHPGKCQFWICRRYPPCPYVLLVPPLPGHRSNTSWLVPLHASKTLRDSCRLHCIA